MFAQGWSRKASLISAIAQHKSKHSKLPRRWEKIFNWIFLKTLNIIEAKQGQKESLRHCLFQNALVAFLAYLAFCHAMLKTPCKPSQLCWNACHACARAVSTTALGGETCNSIRLHRPYMTLSLFLTHWKCGRLKKKCVKIVKMCKMCNKSKCISSHESWICCFVYSDRWGKKRLNVAQSPSLNSWPQV